MTFLPSPSVHRTNYITATHRLTTTRRERRRKAKESPPYILTEQEQLLWVVWLGDMQYSENYHIVFAFLRLRRVLLKLPTITETCSTQNYHIVFAFLHLRRVLIKVIRDYAVSQSDACYHSKVYSMFTSETLIHSVFMYA